MRLLSARSAVSFCLSINTIAPLGLIVNELVSNALKYTFPAKKHGEITIDFCRFEAEQCLLTVRDNGTGLPTLDLEKTKSLGLKLVVILVRQLKGNISLANQDGAVFQIIFSTTRS